MQQRGIRGNAVLAAVITNRTSILCARLRELALAYGRMVDGSPVDRMENRPILRGRAAPESNGEIS